MATFDAFGFVQSLSDVKNTFRRRMATVVSIETYSITVNVAGDASTSISGVRYFGHYAPKVGAQVWLDTDGVDVIAVGAVAGLGGGFPVARVYKTSSTQNVANAVVELVTFSSVDFDPHGMFDNANDQFVAPVAGTYYATATIAFNANATGVRDVRIYQNSLQKMIQRTPSAGGSLDTWVTGSTLLDLAIGDTVSAWAYQSSGGSLLLNASGSLASMSLHYVGPTL